MQNKPKNVDSTARKNEDFKIMLKSQSRVRTRTPQYCCMTLLTGQVVFYTPDSAYNKQILKCFLVFTLQFGLAKNKIQINISQTQQQSRCNKRTQCNQSSVIDLWCGIVAGPTIREWGWLWTIIILHCYMLILLQFLWLGYDQQYDSGRSRWPAHSHVYHMQKSQIRDSLGAISNVLCPGECRNTQPGNIMRLAMVILGVEAPKKAPP